MLKSENFRINSHNTYLICNLSFSNLLTFLNASNSASFSSIEIVREFIMFWRLMIFLSDSYPVPKVFNCIEKAWAFYIYYSSTFLYEFKTSSDCFNLCFKSSFSLASFWNSAISIKLSSAQIVIIDYPSLKSISSASESKFILNPLSMFIRLLFIL